MGRLPAQAPFEFFTFSKWCLACHPSTSLSKEPATPPAATTQVLGPPLCLSPGTVVFFLLINSPLFFTTFLLCGNSFLQSQRAQALVTDHWSSD